MEVYCEGKKYEWVGTRKIFESLQKINPDFRISLNIAGCGVCRAEKIHLLSIEPETKEISPEKKKNIFNSFFLKRLNFW